MKSPVVLKRTVSGINRIEDWIQSVGDAPVIWNAEICKWMESRSNAEEDVLNASVNRHDNDNIAARGNAAKEVHTEEAEKEDNDDGVDCDVNELLVAVAEAIGREAIKHKDDDGEMNCW